MAYFNFLPPVGYCDIADSVGDQNRAGGEFGSISNDLRLWGSIPATEVALSFSASQVKNGNFSVNICVKLPSNERAFGMTSKTFDATLMCFQKDGRAKLKVESPTDYRHRGDSVELMARVFEFSLDTAPPTDFSWESAKFTVESTGVTIMR
jgi:hypothetical protein